MKEEEPVPNWFNIQPRAKSGGKNERAEGSVKIFSHIYRGSRDSRGKHAWVRSQPGDRESGARVQRKRVLEKFRRLEGRMEREDPRNADRPAGNILAPSYLPVLSCRISTGQHTAKLSHSLPVFVLCHDAASITVPRDALSPRASPGSTGENYCILKQETMK